MATRSRTLTSVPQAKDRAREPEPPSPDVDAPVLRRIFRSRTVPWALFLVALIGALTFGFLWQGARTADRQRAEVAGTATRFLTALTNFSATTIQQDVAEIRGYAVGDFADQVNQFFGPAAVDALRRADARSAGRVESVYVESLSGGSAEVFGVVNEAVTNRTNPAPRTEVVRVDVQLIQTAHGWKVSRVNILQSPGQGPLGGA
jgi:hypothetical protein